MKTMKRTATAFLALATGLAGQAARAQDVFVMNEIVVSGAQEATDARRTGVSVSVLDSDEITKTGEISLTSILSRLPGVGVLARGPLGNQTGLTVRGLSQNYLKVLVDGIDVSDPSGPQSAFDFGRLTSLGVDRLELLRGSQSAVYGGQAIAGVMSISTPLPEEEGLHGSALAEYGSYNSTALEFSSGYRKGDSALGLVLSHVNTSGFSAADENDGNTEADGYEADRLSLRGETTLTNGVKLGFSAFIEDSEGEWDPQYALDPAIFLYVPLSDGQTHDEKSNALSRGIRVFTTFDTGAFENTVAFSHFRIDRKLTGTEYAVEYDEFWMPSGTYLQGTDYVYRGRRDVASWKSATDLGDGRLSFGADTTRETYRGEQTYDPDPGFWSASSDASSRTNGVFAEYAWAPTGNFDLTASFRHDDHSSFGGQDTGRVAAAWQVAPDVTVRGSVGTGYRAPSGYELYGPYGDTTLEPEESVSADLGIEKRWSDMTALRATLFWIETDNLIDYSYTTYTYAQVDGTTRRSGLELEGTAGLTDTVSLTAAYTYTDADNPELSDGSAWRAGFGRHQLALGLDAELAERLKGSLTMLYVADRQTLPDYAVAGATMRYDLGNDTEAYLRVENLFDEEYQLWEGYGTSDRAFYVGLRKTF